MQLYMQQKTGIDDAETLAEIEKKERTYVVHAGNNPEGIAGNRTLADIVNSVGSVLWDKLYAQADFCVNELDLREARYYINQKKINGVTETDNNE